MLHLSAQPHRLWSALLLCLGAWLVLGGVACLDYSGQGPACVPGAAIACTCEDGGAGWQVCQDTGAWGTCRCDEPLGGGLRPRQGTALLRVEPGTLDFSQVRVGERASRRVTLTNDGDRDAVMSLELTEALGPQDQHRELSWDVDAPPDQTSLLAPGERRVVTVVYQPVDTSPDRGEVIIREHREDDVEPFAVQITADGSLQDIDAPDFLVLGRVRAGESLTESLRISNVGGAPLTLHGVELLDGANYSACLLDPTAPGGPCQAVEPQEMDLVIDAGQALELRVTYAPQGEGNDDSALVLRSDDPDEDELVVRLLAGATEPCLEVLDPQTQRPLLEGQEVDFGQVELGRRGARQLWLSNCSVRSELVVGGLRTSGDTSFSASEDGLPLLLGPGERAPVVLGFAPERLGEHLGALVVVSNDASRQSARVPLRGEAIPFDNCAVAVASARVEGDPEASGTNLTTAPLETLTLDASGSFDPDQGDGISRYEWTVVQRPSGSTSPLEPLDDLGVRQTMFLDLVGLYRFQLRVFDQSGQPSCEEALVTVYVVANEDIHVQLVWTTPGDDDELEGPGTDLDLHLLHPNGRWDMEPWDCYWASREPDWGLRGNPSDDPSLDIDDTDGAGPENINLDNPEALVYRVGVYYFSDAELGVSYATTRVYLGGVLAFEINDRALRNHDFWEVARIDWRRVAVDPVDTVRNEFP